VDEAGIEMIFLLHRGLQAFLVHRPSVGQVKEPENLNEHFI